MRIVCLSDTHHYPVKQEIPDGDVLVHAGDLTLGGTIHQIIGAWKWLATLPHKHKVVIAGNHDLGFENKPAEARYAVEGASVIYLQDSGTVIDGIKFWGSPYTPRFFDWAFQLDPHTATPHWAKIPEGTNVLITHGPPRGVLDLTPRGERVGCPALAKRVQEVAPALHVFGHIHHSRGVAFNGKTWSINAAICDEQYRHANAPIVVDLDVTTLDVTFAQPVLE